MKFKPAMLKYCSSYDVPFKDLHHALEVYSLGPQEETDVTLADPAYKVSREAGGFHLGTTCSARKT